MSTRAISQLKRQNIPFEVVRYEHHAKGAVYAARATGFALEQTVKTLVVALEEKQYRLALLPGHCQLDLKTFARVCGAKRAVMADTESAERLTGYRVGGISPFGTRQNLPAVMEGMIEQFETVLINAGQRGTMLKMAVRDIVQVLDCQVATIAKTNRPD